MKLPNAAKAVVEREKVAGYLLNPAHPDNGGKAQFFLGLGFQRDDWRPLAAAFRKLVEGQSVANGSALSSIVANGHQVSGEFVIFGPCRARCDAWVGPKRS